VICDEILSWLGHFVRGLEINDETLALDVIDQVGPDGQFLDSDHTLRHFRELWYPRLFDRNNYDGWLAKGGTTLAERAAKRVATILAEHKPEPLPDDVAQAVHAVVERAEAANHRPQ
jgi:trimethylamine--corrinoid protein Co-methyltransferase